jgi:uncharacterized protein with LGFP repeats
MNRLLNHTLASANWETVNFGADLKQIYGLRVQNRSAVDVQISYIAAGTVFWTVKSGAVKEWDWNTPKAPVLYVKGTAPNVIEVEVSTTP